MPGAPSIPQKRTTALPKRCYGCFRPVSLCFCKAIPRILNRTEVLILQHVGERAHPFNTARIVSRSLNQCRIITDHNRKFNARSLPLQSGAGLLYPGDGAVVLDDLPPEQRPRQLVIIDGTWHQARTIVRDTPQLQALPCFRLTPSQPGQYRIRLEPDAQSLSTVEATVSALRTLEPQTEGWDELLAAFDVMVTDQLKQRGDRTVQRHKKSRSPGPIHIPRSILQDPGKLVVAYGETPPRREGRAAHTRCPINWFAQRFGSGERFESLLRPSFALSDQELSHMGLTRQGFDAAITFESFAKRWREFLNHDDQLIVYHQNTYQLAHAGGQGDPRCLPLKSIFGKLSPGFQTLEDLLVKEGLDVPSDDSKCRAELRLQMAIMMLHHLRHKYGELPEFDAATEPAPLDDPSP